MEGNLDIYYPFSFLFSKSISIWYLIIILLYPPLKVTIVFSGIVVCLYVRTSFPLLCVCVFLPKKKKNTLSIIPYNFTTHPTSQTLIFFLPFYLNILPYCNQQPQQISNTRRNPTTPTLIKPTTTINHHLYTFYHQPWPKHHQNPLASKPNTTHTHSRNPAPILQLEPH